MLVKSLLIYSAKTNAADSGEGGILPLPFFFPWVIFPGVDSWLSSHIDSMQWVFYFVNTVTIYFVFGGLRALLRKPKSQWMRCRNGLATPCSLGVTP